MARQDFPLTLCQRPTANADVDEWTLRAGDQQYEPLTIYLSSSAGPVTALEHIIKRLARRA